MDAKGEVLITIMASLAQQESQSLSQNVKLGLQFRYQNGQVQVNHNRFLGYTKDAEGHLVIDPAQAEVVKRIYREYLEGYSMENYLLDGRCELSNNLAENAIRPFTVGRKNWLFCDTVRGAKASAVIYSLIETARANDLSPKAYLHICLANLPSMDFRQHPEELLSLMPWSAYMQSCFKQDE